MVAAREVGGNFYDTFELGSDRIGFAIAEVSGKGVTAALFMAVSCTLLRSIAREVSRPADVLAMLNDALSKNNDASMFVTLVYGVLDATTGAVECACAGQVFRGFERAAVDLGRGHVRNHHQAHHH